MKKLIILAFLVITVITFAVNMPVQPMLWYNVEELVNDVEKEGRADLIRMLVYRNLDPIINFTNYDIWLNNEPFAKYDIDEPITKAEVMTMFVKYLGLERKAIEEYPRQAPYDNNIKTIYENAEEIYKEGFDAERIWGYEQILEDKGIFEGHSHLTCELSFQEMERYDKLCSENSFKDVSFEREADNKWIMHVYVTEKNIPDFLKGLDFSKADFNMEKTVTKANFIKYLIKVFVAKNPDYSYLTDKVEEASGRYTELKFDKELAAYIYIFENYFLVPSGENAKPLLADEKIYGKKDSFNFEVSYNDPIKREEALALFARIALAEFKKAEETKLLVPVRDIQNVISYKAEYDGQLVFEEVTMPDVNVSNIEVYEYDEILEIWEEQNNADSKTEKEKFEEKLAKFVPFVVIETDEENTYLALKEANYSYSMDNPPNTTWSDSGINFGEAYSVLPKEAKNEEIIHKITCDVIERVKEGHVIDFKINSSNCTCTVNEETIECEDRDTLNRTVDLSGVKPKLSLYYNGEDEPAVVKEDVTLFPHELLRFNYEEITKWVKRKEIDQSIFLESQITPYPVAARILYSGETMTVAKLKEFVNSFGEDLRSSDKGIIDRINYFKDFTDVLDLIGVTDETKFVGNVHFSNKLGVNEPVVNVNNPELHYELMGKLVSADLFEIDDIFNVEMLTQIKPVEKKLKGNVFAVIENAETPTVERNMGIENMLFAEDKYGLVSKLSGDYILYIEKHEDDENITDYFLRITKE